MVKMLQKKVFRDIRENRRAFLSIVCTCSLGIALFNGISLYMSMVENEVADYYKEANLADYWVYKADISESDLDHLRSFTDIQEAQCWKITDIALLGALDSVLYFHAVDEAAKTNVPELLTGSLLDGNETNALLFDSRFAQTHGLSVGDTIIAREDESQKEWRIRGVVRDTEYVHYAPEGLTVPDYHRYGSAYTNTSVLPNIDYNELTPTIREGSRPSQEEQSNQVRKAFESATILSRSHRTSYCKVADVMTGVK